MNALLEGILDDLRAESWLTNRSDQNTPGVPEDEVYNPPTPGYANVIDIE